MGGVLQTLMSLEQNEAPNRLVDLVVLRIVLFDDEAPEIVRDAREVAHETPNYSMGLERLGQDARRGHPRYAERLAKRQVKRPGKTGVAGGERKAPIGTHDQSVELRKQNAQTEPDALLESEVLDLVLGVTDVVEGDGT